MWSYFFTNSYPVFSPVLSTFSRCKINGYVTRCPDWSYGVGFIFIIITVILMIISLVSMWQIYKKAGKPGWTSIIPIYGFVVMLDIVRKPIWWIVLSFIPFVNTVIMIIVLYHLAKSFGKSWLFMLGLLFFPFIFYPILAFGNSKYIYNKQESNTGTENKNVPTETKE